MFDFSKAKDWIIAEPEFDPTALGKGEACFALGNGYLGLRSATEEAYPGETRDLLVAGSFDRFSAEEVTELPNAADMTNIELFLNGERFDLTQGELLYYNRELNLKTGLLRRVVMWEAPSGGCYALKFERIVSLKRLHTIVLRMTLIPEADVTLRVRSGIDGRRTNDGSQHFTEGMTRFYEKKFLQYSPRTLQSDILFVHDAVHRLTLDGVETEPEPDINILRRRMFSDFTLRVRAGETLILEKYANVCTARDREFAGMKPDALRERALELLKEDLRAGFDVIAAESAECWRANVWDRAPVEICGPEKDQCALRFAQYHMQIMTPAHDNRMNIGAKGLTGEGYKGHTFWDTEIFLLPYFIFTMPEVARSLLEYRYLSLPGAHAKARRNGYDGAQFPWESAWLDDGEVTPEYLGTDIHTGTPIKVWSGLIEIHVTSDVAFGVWQYYACTGDRDYMERCGYELIFDCAKFWVSRLEPGEDGKLHIRDVVGPDEFKEHVDDNAFTNYMARWTMLTAAEYAKELRENMPEKYAELDEKLGLSALLPRWEESAASIYLTSPNEEGVLPQDSTYLTLPQVDLSKYKAQAHVGGIYKDYNQEQINGMQVSKQADVMALFFLLEDWFSPEVKRASWDYYAPRTLHDSSLSLSTHSVLASDIGDTAEGYALFRRACDIDLGNGDAHSSDAGIHAAACGGLWQCAVYGFGGLRMVGGKLRISPRLPKEWSRLRYALNWQGRRLTVTVTPEAVDIENETDGASVELEVEGKQYTFQRVLTVRR